MVPRAQKCSVNDGYDYYSYPFTVHDQTYNE